MKNFYSLLVAAALCTPSLSNAAVFTVGDLQFTSLDETTCRLTKSFASGCDLVIPSKVTDEETGTEYTVVSIQSGVFRSSTITSCVVPGTITKPGPMLFNMCRSLKSVTFEEGVEELGYNSFPMCSQLTTVNLPSTLTVLGGEDEIGLAEGSAFSGCVALQSITIPAGVHDIPVNTFSNCSALSSVTFEGEITSIGSQAFNNCSALDAELSFPALTSLASDAFSYSAIRSIELGGDLTEIPANAFYSCQNLSDVFLSEGLRTIGQYAFNNCTALDEITFPETVTELASEAFKGCDALISITCLSTTPATATSNTFPASVYEKALLEVPASAGDAYKAAECWKLFTNYSLVTGVNEVQHADVSVKPAADAIVIEGTDAVAEVYTVSGQLAARTSAREIALASGIYIVRVGQSVFKINLR